MLDAQPSSILGGFTPYDGSEVIIYPFDASDIFALIFAQALLAASQSPITYASRHARRYSTINMWQMKYQALLQTAIEP